MNTGFFCIVMMWSLLPGNQFFQILPIVNVCLGRNTLIWNEKKKENGLYLLAWSDFTDKRATILQMSILIVYYNFIFLLKLGVHCLKRVFGWVWLNIFLNCATLQEIICIIQCTVVVDRLCRTMIKGFWLKKEKQFVFMFFSIPGGHQLYPVKVLSYSAVPQ